MRGPDISFLSKESLAKLDLSRPSFPGAPDLAVEVYSPSDSQREIRRKIAQYFGAGAKEVWVAYPEDAAVEVFKSMDEPRRLTGDVLTSETILPGFCVPVSEFFREN